MKCLRVSLNKRMIQFLFTLSEISLYCLILHWVFQFAVNWYPLETIPCLRCTTCSQKTLISLLKSKVMILLTLTSRHKLFAQIRSTLWPLVVLIRRPTWSRLSKKMVKILLNSLRVKKRLRCASIQPWPSCNFAREENCLVSQKTLMFKLWTLIQRKSSVLCKW